MSAAVSGDPWRSADPVLRATTIRVGAHSSPGRGEQSGAGRHRDAWLADPPVFVVADGVVSTVSGGPVEEASAIVLRTFGELAGRAGTGTVGVQEVEAAVETCRREVSALAAGADGSPASTLVAATLLVEAGRPYWLVAGLGDSRAYLYADGRLEQLTRDHPHGLGLFDAPVDYSLVRVSHGDRLLLCSNGLSDAVPHHVLRDVLAVDVLPQVSAEELVRQAMSGDGSQDATAVVVDVSLARDEAPGQSWVDPLDADTGGLPPELVDTRPGGWS